VVVVKLLFNYIYSGIRCQGSRRHKEPCYGEVVLAGHGGAAHFLSPMLVLRYFVKIKTAITRRIKLFWNKNWRSVALVFGTGVLVFIITNLAAALLSILSFPAIFFLCIFFSCLRTECNF